MINKRKIERDGYCRGCYKPMLKNTEIVYAHTYRGSIYFCLCCAKTIGELANNLLKNTED